MEALTVRWLVFVPANTSVAVPPPAHTFPPGQVCAAEPSGGGSGAVYHVTTLRHGIRYVRHVRERDLILGEVEAPHDSRR